MREDSTYRQGQLFSCTPCCSANHLSFEHSVKGGHAQVQDRHVLSVATSLFCQGFVGHDLVSWCSM